jgi:hypothetical protein
MPRAALTGSAMLIASGGSPPERARCRLKHRYRPPKPYCREICRTRAIADGAAVSDLPQS